MPREDKGTSSASPLKDPSGGGGEQTSSLAARRARLRGTLARATTPQDESFEQLPSPTFDQDGFVAVPINSASDEGAAAASSSEPTPDVQEGGFDHGAATGSGAPAVMPVEEDTPAADPAPATEPEPASQSDDESAAASVTAPVVEPEPQAESQPAESPQADSQPAEEPQAESPPAESPQADSQPAESPQAESPPADPQPVEDQSSAAAQDPAPFTTPSPGSFMSSSPEPVPQQITPPSPPPSFSVPALTALPSMPSQALELLSSIDQAMNACATNLASMQRMAGEQTDVLINLTNTLQNQTLSQIGLNLNSLTDSLSAALEPMKAIGELVPAMDNLVTTLEGREAYPSAEKLSPDQLVTSLADQLSAGLIDPWTFKCAYMAVYPTDHPADLLHRLVELLGTQRLSGDLFRAAYEAVQAAEPPGGGFSQMGNLDPSQVDESVRKQLDQLHKSNEEMRKRQEDREAELQRILETKDRELSELHEKMQGKYEEVSESIGKREDEYRSLLESKDMELVEKESENNMLRAQMEELRSQTEDMVKEMQKQMGELKTAHEESVANQPAKPVSSFFDNAPSPARSLFDSGAQKALFDQQQQQQQQQMSGGQPGLPLPSAPTQQQPQMPVQQMLGGTAQTTTQPMQAMQPIQPMSQPMQQQMQQPLQPNQGPVAQSLMGQPQSAPINAGGAPPTTSAVVPPAPPPPPAPPAPPPRPQPAQPTTPFTSQGQGSYGSGVRAQVFEVIVRQALAGAPWREICAGPMQVNNITPDEVEAEVKRRQALLNR